MSARFLLQRDQPDKKTTSEASRLAAMVVAGRPRGRRQSLCERASFAIATTTFDFVVSAIEPNHSTQILVHILRTKSDRPAAEDRLGAGAESHRPAMRKRQPDPARTRCSERSASEAARWPAVLAWMCPVARDGSAATPGRLLRARMRSSAYSRSCVHGDSS